MATAEKAVEFAELLQLNNDFYIYEACVTRDGKQAEQETKDHLERVFEAIMKAMD